MRDGLLDEWRPPRLAGERPTMRWRLRRWIERVRRAIGGVLWRFVEQEVEGAITRRALRHLDTYKHERVSRCTEATTLEPDRSPRRDDLGENP